MEKLDKLALDSTIGNLPSHNFQVSVTTSGQDVAREFQDNPELPGVTIVNTDRELVGIISRTHFYEWLSRPYALDMFLRRPIQSLWKTIADKEQIASLETLMKKYLQLSATCEIDKAVELALKRPPNLAYEPILVEWEDGRKRLLDMQVLLLAQSQLFSLAKDTADGANRAKSEFLANMSHELRTPLNAIIGFTSVMVRDRGLSGEQQKYLDIISHSGEHLLELINDVLEMSKIEAGKVSFTPSSFDLHRLLDNLREMLRVKASSKGLRLVFERSPDVPQYVRTDERKLREVLINLIGNAIKFTREGGIVLRVRNDSPDENTVTANLRFEVEDTGLGIAPEEIQKLFTAFGQTATGQKAQQGTGLGLAISQKFVQMMGGEISVESTVGQGTTFIFNIQLAIAQASETQTVEESRKIVGLAPGQPQSRILVVEDRAENRLLAVKLLASLGFDVREAENGREAIEQWATHSPHLILMDIRMPVMDGYEATKHIRVREQLAAVRSGDSKTQNPIPTVPIIALTASVFEDEKSAILAAGCDDVVCKPFREQILLERIAKSLGVRYLYEDSAIASPTNVERAPANVELLQFHLSQMSQEWVDKLYQATLKCLDSEILQQLEEIPEEGELLANTLRDWTDNFLFDRIIDLLTGSA
ncbi:MAG: ATP-binding protein [Cyanobacteriota bacterium]|nr:ATP-binding protein [Cyanobacteriota bacterium]